MSSPINWDNVVRALETPQQDAQWRRPLATPGWWLLVGTFLCIFGSVLYLPIRDLENAWRTTDPLNWDFFWQSAFLSLLLASFASFACLNTLGALTRRQQDILAIRQALARDNDQGVSVAPRQPLELRDNPVNYKHEIGPLTRSKVGELGAATAQATLLVAASIILVPLSLIFSLTPSGDIAGPVVSVMLGAGVLLLVVSAVHAVRTAHALNRDIHAVADEWGLKWPDVSARKSFLGIPWSRARAFVTLHFQRPIDAFPRDVFVLDAPDAVLAWEITNRSTAEQRAAHESLRTRQGIRATGKGAHVLA